VPLRPSASDLIQPVRHDRTTHLPICADSSRAYHTRDCPRLFVAMDRAVNVRIHSAKVKVLLASHGPTLVGGAERSLLEIACRLRQRGDLEIRVAAPAEGPLTEALTAAGVEPVVLPYQWAASAPFALVDPDAIVARLDTIRQYLTTSTPDVIVTNTTVIPWFGYLSQMLGIPHAWFLREDVTADLSLDFYPDARQTLDLIDRCSDHLFVNSAFLRNRYGALLGRDDIDVIHPSFDRRILDYYVAAEGPHEGIVRILVSGTVRPAKNQIELLEAAAILRRKRDDFHVTVMGGVATPDYHEELLRFVRENGLEETVTFLDHQDDPYAVMREHDLCVVPSQSEPFGRVAVEAMLLGKPVIASDSGGNRETVGRLREKGLLYTLGRPDLLAKRIERLMNDRATMHRIGSLAHDYAVGRYLGSAPLDLMDSALRKLAVLEKQPREDWITAQLLAGNQRRAVDLDVLTSQLDAERQTAGTLGYQVAELTSQLDAERQSTGALTTQLDVERQTTGALGNQVAELTSQLEAEQQSTRALGNQVAELTDRLSSQERLVFALRSEMGELDRQIASERSVAQLQAGRIESLVSELAAEQEMVSMLKASTSWRVTAPLRAVSLLIRGMSRQRDIEHFRGSGRERLRVAILIHELQTPDEGENDYAIGLVAKLWREEGHEVRFIPAGTADWPADVAILHVDNTVVPRRFARAARRYPAVINGRILDIRKTRVSSPMLQPERGYRGPVFVKSNLNSDGIPERRLAQRSRFHRIAVRLFGKADGPVEAVKVYGAYDSAEHVPTEMLRRPDTIVQKFIPEMEDGRYFVRRCFVFGERIIAYRMGHSNPTVDAHENGLFSWIEPEPEVVVWKRAVGLDYGTIDYVMHEGHAVVFDVNKTPGRAQPPDEQGQRDYERIIRHIAPGLYEIAGQATLRSAS
jgi:glycosyltransferase involved in cell wall biosynthesis